MAKFVHIKDTRGVYEFYCPGCKTKHSVWTANEIYPHPVWRFNNDLEKPTIHPSIKVEWNNGEQKFICHSFITYGKIQYLSDCTHDLAGQTVSLPDME